MDPLHTNMTYMFVQLFMDALNEYAYAAELAGLNYSLNSTMYGMYVSIDSYHVHTPLRIPARTCEEVASDLALGGGFAGYSGFLHLLQLASNDLATICQKKWRQSKFQIPTMYIVYHVCK